MPRIAIPVPTSHDAAYNMRSWPNYAAAVRQAGGDPIELPLTRPLPELLALAATCDGILLPGSPADIDPARFGAERDPASAPADLPRETLDFALLDHASATRKPALGICYGCQSMNAWRGGALVQDLMPVPVNHSAGREVAIAHTALVAKNSLLGSLVDPAEAPLDGDFFRLPVNTSHHQSVASPGEGLRIVSRCPEDGVVEAIEADPAEGFLLAVQWHPERSIDISATSRNLFTRLVAEAGQAAARVR